MPIPDRAPALLVADLKEHQIDYLVIGAIALMAHGYQRFTEDIDLEAKLAPDDAF